MNCNKEKCQRYLFVSRRDYDRGRSSRGRDSHSSRWEYSYSSSQRPMYLRDLPPIEKNFYKENAMVATRAEVSTKFTI